MKLIALDMDGVVNSDFLITEWLKNKERELKENITDKDKLNLQIKKSFLKEFNNSTELIFNELAQRINTIMDAEQIIVLEDGRIVGKGTHDELMKSCETYKEIADSQLGGEAHE
jgi:ABC-type transport system involved in Fe-S cluster assembly fused permease/ATPase subunit